MFCLLSSLSPHTADAFAQILVGLDLQAGSSARASHPRRVKPTLPTPPSEELEDEHVAWLFQDRTRVMSLHQLETFLPLMMKNLKPHRQGAGILPEGRINTRNMVITTGQLLDRFVPYMEEHQNEPFLHLLGLLRDCEIIAPYEKPPRA